MTDAGSRKQNIRGFYRDKVGLDIKGVRNFVADKMICGLCLADVIRQTGKELAAEIVDCRVVIIDVRVFCEKFVGGHMRGNMVFWRG